MERIHVIGFRLPMRELDNFIQKTKYNYEEKYISYFSYIIIILQNY